MTSCTFVVIASRIKSSCGRSLEIFQSSRNLPTQIANLNSTQSRTITCSILRNCYLYIIQVIMMAEIKIFNHPRPKKSVLPPLPKKRKTDHKIEEISFDFDKRADYLTGFHKRKVARIKLAQAEAEKKAREERVDLRKTVRSIL